MQESTSKPVAFTSYYARAVKLDRNVYELIPISTSVPSWTNIPKRVGLSLLEPGWDLVNDIKRGVIDKEEYTRRYKMQLNRIHIHEVVESINFISLGKIPVLLCYENPSQFCHRHIVAEWLSDHYDIKELDI